MKKNLLCAFVILSFAQMSQAQGLRGFLKSCAWGTVVGAGLGVVSLALEDRPGDSWGNVAKGASLGLYGGIAYGIYQGQKAPQTFQEPDFALVPQFSGTQLEGVKMVGTLYRF